MHENAVFRAILCQYLHVCDLFICSMLGMLCHIRRPTMNLRASENSSENADRVVGFFTRTKIPSLSVSLIYSLNMDE